jgi:SnoaL-like domain
MTMPDLGNKAALVTDPTATRGRIDRRLPIDAGVRMEVVDLVNRLNMAFDIWDVETMVEAFTEDCVVYHPRGTVRGHEEVRRFYDGYRPLTIGVRRQNLNHVVDAYEDGTITVVCYNMLVRVAPAERAEIVRESMLTQDVTGLPAIFMHSIITDRLRRDDAGIWRIMSRHVDQTVANATLRTPSENAASS